MKTALICIATGPRYWSYAERMLESAARFFVPHDSFVWSDSPRAIGAGRNYVAQYRGYPAATLYRYHTFLEKAQELLEYDQVFYCDADMLWVSEASGADIFSDGITATLHPGYFVRNRCGLPETRPTSTAYVSGNSFYYCGGFNGGDARAYVRMAETIARNIDLDRRRGIVAVWHDESHLQRYLQDNTPAKVLTPAYCYPEGYGGGYGWSPLLFKPVLVALEKDGRD